MYAVIKTGGKQYRVSVGDIIDVELVGEECGACVTFEDVLFVFDGEKQHIGKPHLSEFPVSAEVIGESKGEKITSLKYKRSHNQCRKWGHRQKYTRIKITKIGRVA